MAQLAHPSKTYLTPQPVCLTIKQTAWDSTTTVVQVVHCIRESHLRAVIHTENSIIDLLLQEGGSKVSSDKKQCLRVKFVMSWEEEGCLFLTQPVHHTCSWP